MEQEPKTRKLKMAVREKDYNDLSIPELLSAFNRAQEIRATLRDNERKLKTLERAIERDQAVLKQVKDVGEFYRGMPLTRISKRTPRATTIFMANLAVERKDHRTIEIYLNTHNKKTFGCYTSSVVPGCHWQMNKEWQGSSFTDRAELLIACKEFLATGSLDAINKLKEVPNAKVGDAAKDKE